jgi:peptidyl-prolyl cis-trans isomerase-like 2
MGKGTDKLYITHSEWSSEDAYGASVGAGVSGNKRAIDATFKRLPFNFCAVSLQPFRNPVCNLSGTIFDHERILEWMNRYGNKNPVDGSVLKNSDLIKLKFVKNDDNEYVDPVTFKVFTDNTHIIAIRNTGNVFAWDTVDQLNIKAKNWRDLVTDEEFTRKDIITLQDPYNLGSRDLKNFQYIQDGAGLHNVEKDTEQNSKMNTEALGSLAKILKAKEAVAKARAGREHSTLSKPTTISDPKPNIQDGRNTSAINHISKPDPYNAAKYTTGRTAASFTSTGLTPETSGERAILTDEEYMLRPKRVKHNGYARIQTSLGEMTIELLPEWAPKAVYNFVQLSKRGYYKGTLFHRNIRNFMIQGGDPTGTGRGGTSCWGRTFEDELEGPNTHNARGILSMANKGKNTNSSQFFFTYRQAPHLDRKHTIFGRVVEGMETLEYLESAKTDDKNRPLEDISITDIAVLVDPFEEFLKQRAEREEKEREIEDIKRQGGTDDDKVTWTGKRIRTGDNFEQNAAVITVGKYLKQEQQHHNMQAQSHTSVAKWDAEEPAKKKARKGFGNFDSW